MQDLNAFYNYAMSRQLHQKWLASKANGKSQANDQPNNDEGSKPSSTSDETQQSSTEEHSLSKDNKSPSEESSEVNETPKCIEEEEQTPDDN